VIGDTGEEAVAIDPSPEHWMYPSHAL
jgi:hypothetical protein